VIYIKKKTNLIQQFSVIYIKKKDKKNSTIYVRLKMRKYPFSDHLVSFGLCIQCTMIFINYACMRN